MFFGALTYYIRCASVEPFDVRFLLHLGDCLHAFVSLVIFLFFSLYFVLFCTYIWPKGLFLFLLPFNLFLTPRGYGCHGLEWNESLWCFLSNGSGVQITSIAADFSFGLGHAPFYVYTQIILCYDFFLFPMLNDQCQQSLLKSTLVLMVFYIDIQCFKYHESIHGYVCN